MSKRLRDANDPERIFVKISAGRRPFFLSRPQSGCTCPPRPAFSNFESPGDTGSATCHAVESIECPGVLAQKVETRVRFGGISYAGAPLDAMPPRRKRSEGPTRCEKNKKNVNKKRSLTLALLSCDDSGGREASVQDETKTRMIFSRTTNNRSRKKIYTIKKRYNK